VVFGVLAPAFALSVSGCDRGDPWAPPEIYYGQDVCDTCGMIISDDRYAAAIIEGDGSGVKRRLFDDVGEMLAVDTGERQVHRYVHGFQSGHWLDAGDAVYVLGPEIQTPMATGVVAFESAQAAQQYAGEHGGRVMDLSRCRQALADGLGGPGAVPGGRPSDGAGPG